MIRNVVAMLLVVTGYATAEETLTIVSYNIHHAEGVDGKLDVERIAHVVRDLRPDVVCLQEVDRNLPRTELLDMPALLSRALEMNVVFGDNFAFDNGLYGNATLTALPILESENVRLPNPNDAEPRGCLRIRIAKGGHTIDIFNTHLGLDDGERRAQAAAIVDSMRELPAVLAGDLNATLTSAPLRILQTCFRDTYESNDGMVATTLPGSATPRRIDYVLVTPRITILDARIVVNDTTRVASDHYPYVARVSMGARPETLLDKGVSSVDDERLEDVLLKDNQ